MFKRDHTEVNTTWCRSIRLSRYILGFGAIRSFSIMHVDLNTEIFGSVLSANSSTGISIATYQQ